MLRLTITLPNNAQINLESEDEVVIDRILGIVLTDVTRAILAGLGSSEVGNVPPAASAAPERVAPTADGEPLPVVPTAGAAPQPLSATPPSVTPQPANEPAPAGGTAAPPTYQAPSQPTVLFEVGAGTPPAQPAETGQEGVQLAPVISDWEVSLEDVTADEPWPQLNEALNGEGKFNGGLRMGQNHVGMADLVPAVSEQAFVDFCRAANPLGDMRRVVVAAEGASRYLARDGVDAEALGDLFDMVGWQRAHNFVQTLRNGARSKFGWLERVPGRIGHYTVTDLGRSTALGQ